MRAARGEELDARCEIRVRALIQFSLLNSVLAERAAQGSIRMTRTNPCRGLYLADGTLFWGGVADTEREFSGGLAPHSLCRVVPRPACAFGAKSPKGGYRSSSVAKSRCCFATGRNQLPVIDGQPDAARSNSRSVFCMAVPLIEGI
jgi:hypothetical protein